MFFSPDSVEEQTITASDLIQQDIDINEPIGNLKKLLEPRVQISLDAFDICLQDIQVHMLHVHTISSCIYMFVPGTVSHLTVEF